MRRGVGSVEGARAGVVGRLRTRQVELVDAIFARVSGGAFAGSGGEDAEYMAGLRAAVAAAVEYGLRGIERADEAEEPIPVALLEQARHAARAGVGLETVLRRYVAGYAMLADFAIEEADSLEFLPELLDRGSALRVLLRVHTSVLERLTAAIAEEYGHELGRAVGSPAQRHGELIGALLAGGEVQGCDLDYDFEGWHLGVVATGTGAQSALRSLQASLGCRLLSVPGGEQTVWAWLGAPRAFAMGDFERAVTTTRAEGGEQARAGAGRLSADVSLAVGEPARGIEGWRVTHRQALEALGVMLRRPRRLTRFADVALLAPWLDDPARARALIEIYLSPLEGLRDGGHALRQTLQAYFAAGQNMNAAAAALGVDRGTVRRRVRMIEEKLARPLHTRQAELEVAMRLEELALISGDAD